MIDIIKGASVMLAVTLKDNNGDVITLNYPTSPLNVMVELYPETTGKVLAKYSVATVEGYDTATIDGNYVKIPIDSTVTDDMPIGKIVGKFIVTYTNTDFSSNVETIISRGAVLNVLP